jgi:predicted outer membrane protein
MKTFSTVAALTVLAVAAAAVSAQSPTRPAPDRSQHHDSAALGQLNEVGANSASCRLKREAIQDSAPSTTFAATAAQDGMVEVALAGMALQKSHNDQVRQFAQKVVEDYAQSNGDLYTIVKCEGLVLPTGLDAKHTALVNSFNARSGIGFDRTYLKHMVKRHSESEPLFEAASRSNDPDVAAFARKGLSTLQEHQLLAGNLRNAGTEVASTH